MSTQLTRDYTLILDKSGSMSTPDQPGGKSRWAYAQESVLALARKCEQLDPDGITVYTFSGKFKCYPGVTTAKVGQIFMEEELALSFIQIGDDQQATAFLKALDNDLQGIGAKFDICDTITPNEMEDLSLAEVLLSAIQD
jgi:hypothetical protein